MRMQTRFAIFMVVYIFGGGLVTVACKFSETSILTWFLVFAIGQFIVFRCPHCRKFVLMNDPESHKSCPHCFTDY
ncbi:MAG: hypothetical protein ACI92S_004169 [Planctomycetaceae bacterium]|jgi:hypothetical protein